MTILTTPAQIAMARKLALKAMLKLEIKGMSRSGRSAYAIIKEEFNLKGSKTRVLEQFTTMIEKQMEFDFE